MTLDQDDITHMIDKPLRNSFVILAAFAIAQCIALVIGWFFVYNATHERIAESVDEVIIDNNRRVAESLVSAIGELPSKFDATDAAWQRAQKLVESVEFGSGGFACILDESGAIACHPDMEHDPSLREINLGSRLITPTDSDEAVSINDIGSDDVQVGVADFSVDGKHYVATQMLTESGARLLVHQPVSGLSAASEQVTSGLLIQMGAAATPILILTVGIGILFIRGHSRSLRRWNADLESKIEHRTLEVRQSRKAIVTALATLADYRDNETGQHVVRISEYSVVLARHLQDQFEEIDEQWIERLRLASMLHDIGKVGVPDAILRKPGKLTDDEFRIIKSHPSFGADTLIKVHHEIDNDPLVQMAAEIALFHHERWDGSGYPTGIQGNQIPLSARITAVADVYDALMSPRVYKPAMPIEKVRSIITESSGSHFDPAIVDAFAAVEAELCEIRSRLEEPKHVQMAA
ncbi:MAG: HD domain-containing protein [Phycisphaera sp.]|nr:MAG: HD domain-containing protein [Phycisphaera sp.]